MGERRNRDLLDVVGGDEVTTRERCAAARELQERQAAAGARPDGEARALARRGHDVDDVATDRRLHVDELDGRLHLEQGLAVDHLRERDVVPAALDASGEHLPLRVAGG